MWYYENVFPGFTSERIAAGDVTIDVCHGGDGPPLLLLHGYPQTHVTWHRIAPTLAKRFTVICPDLAATATATDNAFVITPADDDTTWYASVSLLDDGTYEVDRRDPHRGEHELTTETDIGHIAEDLIIWLGRPQPTHLTSLRFKP
jgi:pimeloyl-ACP methyl ester carboxylesterase